MFMSVEDAVHFCREMFQAAGCSEEDARIVAEALVDANMHGIDSHGISRLPIYIRRMREGRINPKPNVTFTRKGSVVLVSGDNGIGQVVTHKAMQTGLAISKEEGMASVAIRDSNHFGHAFYYCQEVVKHRAFCMMTTNSPKGIAPWGGKDAYFGTNPIAFGFPARKTPVIVDMSSSIVARGKIILAAKNNESIPEGWAIDETGKPTTDPQKALRGAVLPFGGAKGYALALSLEVLAGILSGSAFGSHVQNIYDDQGGPANVGHFMMISNIGHYMDYETYLDRMEQMIADIKNIEPGEEFETISIPGERKEAKAAERKAQGIPLSPEVFAELQTLAQQFQVAMPEVRELSKKR